MSKEKKLAATHAALENAESRKKLEGIYEQLRALLFSEYERGGREAADRILNLVAANDYEKSDIRKKSGVPNRVPHGTARLFLEKVLKAGPLTIRQMRQAARTGLEKQLSYQTIRLELERGRRDRKYKKENKSWSLLKE